MKKIIGISGGSGSGKSTFADQLSLALGAHRCLILRQDSYYKDLSEKFDRDGGQVNFDHPSSIDFDLLIYHLLQLKSGNSFVDVPLYDFKTHKRKGSTRIVNKDYVLVDGILIYSSEDLLKCFDYTVFIETEEPLRFARRLKRDVLERGRTPEGVRAQYDRHVRPMYDEFVGPSKIHAQRVLNGEVSFTNQIEILREEWFRDVDKIK